MSQTLNQEKTRSIQFGAYDDSQVSPLQTYVVTLEKGEDGMIVAKCDELNVVTQGKTNEEAERNSIEAIELVLEETGKQKEFSISTIRKP